MNKLFRLIVIAVVFTTSCKKDIFYDCPDCIYQTGWNSNENFSQSIPTAMNFVGTTFQSGNAVNLPSRVDLTSKFPPIGDQGQLGTCVAWSVAYNLKSYLDGVTNNLSQNQLQSNTNQYSPTDLFFSIPASKRDCEHGTYYDDAFSVLINRGVNTLYSVPYLNNCLQSSPGSASSASANRIKNYRKLSGTVNEIKEYLAQGIPVVIGAKVNRDFQLLRGSNILSYLNYSEGYGGHAMVIAGYDDSRNAFRLINSWRETWGDNGYLWVDYNFLVNSFVQSNGSGGDKALFVAFNDNTIPTNPTNPVGGGDLTAIVSYDITLYPTYSPYINVRNAGFDIKNIGTQTIPASSNWHFYYLWVNAFNANNYGVIFTGQSTTTIPQNTYQNLTQNTPPMTIFNADLISGETLFQKLGIPGGSFTYPMPQLTGYYYIVLYIDKGNANDVNETNNVFYVTQQPKYFVNGQSNRNNNAVKLENKFNFQNIASFSFCLDKSKLDNEQYLSIYRKPATDSFVNAYTSEEIVGFLKYKIKNGGL